jgi:membrane associated rhomboid family serine protease
LIPIRDINPTQTKPVVTYVLIGINVLVFAFQLLIGTEANQDLIMRFGAVPLHLSEFEFSILRSQGGTLGSWVTPLTSMFMHGGFVHIIGNIWFLWVFGDNIEDTLGKRRFILFYVLTGFGAVLAQAAIDPQSAVPMVGASGAISGILAGYVMLYPRARVLTLIPIFIFFKFIEIPAYAFVLVWFGFQVLSGYVSLKAIAVGGGVAYFAHIGGFVVGLILILIMKQKRHETDPD